MENPNPILDGRKVLEIQDIMSILPHRYPFLLIDRLVEIERKKRIVAIKNVTINEPFFAGHFPNFPIMPGVLSSNRSPRPAAHCSLPRSPTATAS